MCCIWYKKISACRRSTSEAIIGIIQTKGKQVNFKFENVWWEPDPIMFACAEAFRFWSSKPNTQLDSGFHQYFHHRQIDGLSIIDSCIRQHQKYQFKWFDAPQLSQSIYVIHAKRQYDEEDMYEEKSITFNNFCVNKVGETLFCEKWQNYKSS